MDFKQLQYVLKVAEVGNFTKASRELYVSQPSLSNFISKVEEELGSPIFNRSTTPVSLTYVGELYVAAAKKILRTYSDMKEEIAEAAENKRGRLIVGIPPARASHMLPHVLPEYSRKYPKVKIETVEHNSRQLKEDVRKGNVDFAILPIVDEIEEFDCHLLYEEELYLVAESGKFDETCYKVVNGRKIIQFERIKDENFILLKKGHGIRNALDAIFSYYGYKPKIYMETTNNETAFRLASVGLGLAVVPEMNINTLRQLNKMDVFQLSEPGMKWNVVALMHKDGYVNTLKKEFLSIIKKEFAEKEKEE